MLSGNGSSSTYPNTNRNESRRPFFLKGSDVPLVCWRLAFLWRRFLERIDAACLCTLVAKKTFARVRSQGIFCLNWFHEKNVPDGLRKFCSRHTTVNCFLHTAHFSKLPTGGLDVPFDQSDFERAV